MGQQKCRDLVSRDHGWWPINGWNRAAAADGGPCPALSAAVPPWTDALPQRVVVDADVGPVQAGASKKLSRRDGRRFTEATIGLYRIMMIRQPRRARSQSPDRAGA